MKNRERRLASVEDWLVRRDGHQTGVMELHCTEAWPGHTDSDLVRCDDPEHGPNCGVSLRPWWRQGRFVRVVYGGGRDRMTYRLGVSRARRLAALEKAAPPPSDLACSNAFQRYLAAVSQGDRRSLTCPQCTCAEGVRPTPWHLLQQELVAKVSGPGGDEI